MDTKKKTIFASVALVAAIAAYPVYQYVTAPSAADLAEAARAPQGSPGYDSSQYLFDGDTTGGLTAAGGLVGSGDKAGISGFSGSGTSAPLDAPISSSTDTEASGDVSPVNYSEPDSGPAGSPRSTGGDQSQYGSGQSYGGTSQGAGARQSTAAGRAKKQKTSRTEPKPPAVKATVAGLPAQLFTGKMTDAQSDDLDKRFKQGLLTKMQEDALIGLVNDGMKFTEKQAQVLRDIRARDDKTIEDAMKAATQTPVQFPEDMQVQRGRYWPVNGRVSQKFGCVDWNVYSGRYYNGVWCPHFHNGLDIAAPLHTPLHAMDAGKVTAVGGTQSSGVYVTVAHPDGMASTYFHMPVGGPTVRVGQFVNANQVVGSIGMTGMTTGPHVHFIVRKGDVIDPRSVLP